MIISGTNKAPRLLSRPPIVGPSYLGLEAYVDGERTLMVKSPLIAVYLLSDRSHVGFRSLSAR